MRKTALILCLFLLAGLLPHAAGEAAGGGAGDSITLSLLGDCSLGDSYQYRETASSYHSMLAREGFAWPFGLLGAYLREDDLTVCNLEVVFTLRSQHQDKRYNLVGDPGHVQALVAGGIDIVNTVNNHSMDFFEAGYLDTLAALDGAGIGHFGSLSLQEGSPHDIQAIKEVKGIRIGFIGCVYPQPADAARLAARISALRGEGGCALVVLSLHWGRETRTTPEVGQIKLAQALIEAGADVIYGHHPHVLQPVQFYRGKPILYSTGNFTFGTMSPVDPATGIFQLHYQVEGGAAILDALQVIPCRTQGSPDFRPYELKDAADREAVFRKLLMKIPREGLDDPPASFLTTGFVGIGQLQPAP